MPSTTRLRVARASRLALAVLATACVHVEPKADFDRARELVEQSTGRDEVFDPYAALLTEDELDALLVDGLSLDEALRLALINNRDLQAEFQDIGIAHADWVQSRLLSNPSLDVLLRFPTGGGRSMLEAIAGVQLLELWRIPVREEAARQNLEATVLRIARSAGARLAETRSAYYAAVAAANLYEVAQENVDLVSTSSRAVEALHAAGAADALDETLARGPLLAAQLALRTARIDAANAKRELARTISLEEDVHALSLTDALPEVVKLPHDAEVLVRQALVSRLDLQAMQAALRALEARVRVERRKAWGDVAAGPAFERPAGSGDDLVGASLSLTPPVFDQNQAQVARAGFELARMTKMNESVRITVAQDVRTSADRVNSAAEGLHFYGEVILPQSERALALARESYTAGRGTLLAVVEVQRQLLDARRGRVSLRLEAARALADLERALGVPLSALEH